MYIVSAVQLQKAGLWCCRPENSKGRSGVGTEQQLKEIPTETESLIACRLSSGWLDFHGLVYPEPCQDTWPRVFTSQGKLYAYFI